jgi:hypothetical protein
MGDGGDDCCRDDRGRRCDLHVIDLPFRRSN